MFDTNLEIAFAPFFILWIKESIFFVSPLTFIEDLNLFLDSGKSTSKTNSIKSSGLFSLKISFMSFQLIAFNSSWELTAYLIVCIVNLLPSLSALKVVSWEEIEKQASKNVIVNATSGAGINIYASEKLDAKANSGGDIDFKGNPKSVNKNSSSGGDISKI